MRTPLLAVLLLLPALTWAKDTPLMFAAAVDNPEVVQALVAAGADLEARDVVGGTPLMFAAGSNANPEVVQALLDTGADATAKNDAGNTAWDLIQKNEALKGTNAYWRLNQSRFE